MGVSRFQPVKDEDQQYATQRDPAPERARFELSPMNDTHSPCLAPNQNIARVQSSINRDSAAPIPVPVALCQLFDPSGGGDLVRSLFGFAVGKPEMWSSPTPWQLFPSAGLFGSNCSNWVSAFCAAQ
jgi:hypothetical protein